MVIAFLALFASTEVVAVPGCLQYEPATVSLRGELTVEVFPGPPNFQDLKRGDQPEHVWVLTLPKPVCVSAQPSDELYRAVPSVTRVQVGFDDVDKYKSYDSLLGHKVVVTGRLYPAHTVHHRTDVLLTIESIKRSGRA